MRYKVWFIEKTTWYVDIEADSELEVEDMVYDGSSEVWDSRDYVNSDLTITHIEGY